MNALKKHLNNTGDPGLSNQPYVGAAGYQTWNTDQLLGSVGSNVQLLTFSGPPGNPLGSNTVSGGLNIHVYDKTYDVDYLLQFYAYFTSTGYANVAVAAYSACAGIGYTCGPAYGNCVWWNCPVASKTIESGIWTGIGSAADPIQLGIYWNTRINGYVFNYKDANVNQYWWTVLDIYPSGTYSTMASNGMVLGNVVDTQDFEVDFFQMGFTMSGVPNNFNWELEQYGTTYALPGQSSHYVDHATSMPINPSASAYLSYWKENWVVSFDSAELGGIGIGGYFSSGPYLAIYYTGGQNCCGGNSFW